MQIQLIFIALQAKSGRHRATFRQIKAKFVRTMFPAAPETAYHLPVMLGPCLEGLALQPAGVYVDVTFGGGGHTRAILERLGPGGRVLGFDQDPDAHAQAAALNDPRFTLIPANFRHLQRYLRVHGLRQVQGILDGIDDIAFCTLTARDVVRHKLVGRIVAAYDQFDSLGPADAVRSDGGSRR